MIEAAAAWYDARVEVDKRERDPRAAVPLALDLALSRTSYEDVRSALEAVASIEREKAAALGDMATRAAALARTIPTREQWESFYDNEVEPASRWIGAIQWCSCGQPFIATGSRHYCSDRCSARERMKGRNTKAAQRTATAAAMKKHAAGCSRCRLGQACARLEQILEQAPPSDALAHVADGLSPDAAEDMIASTGRRKPKRTP